MRGPLALQVLPPPGGGGADDRVIVQGGHEEQLGDVRGVVVPSGRLGRHVASEVPEVVETPPARVKEGQQGLQGPHALLKQGGGQAGGRARAATHK